MTPPSAQDQREAPGGAAASWPEPSHRTSHLAALPWLTTLSTCEETSVDLVVVPTSRDATSAPTSGVALAARLAAAHDCPLLLIVSDQAEREASLRRVRHLVSEYGGGRAPVVLALHEVEPDYRLATHDSPLARAARDISGRRGVEAYVSDVARKRNGALLLARRAGYGTLLFVDDDIASWTPDREGGTSTTLDAAGLTRATGAVRGGEHRAVGWAAREFSDNSVLCRLRGIAGRRQGQMIGAGALLVSVDDETPFFPSIYNEDWLFLLADIAAHGTGAVARAGKVRQDPPEVTVAVDRALLEEFGDVLGEGLMNLVERPRSIVPVGLDRRYWVAVLDARRAMIDDLRSSLASTSRTSSVPLLGPALEALDAVADLHAAAPRDLPDMFCDFVDRWRSDRETWADVMGRCSPEASQTWATEGVLAAVPA